VTFRKITFSITILSMATFSINVTLYTTIQCIKTLKITTLSITI